MVSYRAEARAFEESACTIVEFVETAPRLSGQGTVTSHDLDSEKLELRVSNPRTIATIYYIFDINQFMYYNILLLLSILHSLSLLLI